MLKAYKYRIYPTPEQAQKIDHTIGVCRLVYNLALQVRIWSYQNGRSLSSFDIGKQLKPLMDEYPWIRAVGGRPLIDSIHTIDRAFKNFFNGSGHPRFKRKKQGGSYRCSGDSRKINWEQSLLSIPMIKNIPIVLSRKFEGPLRTVAISKTPTGKYFASILVESGAGLPQKPVVDSKTTIGIDVGIKSFAITSDGRSFEPNRKLKENLKRLKCLQRRASRKKIRSSNYKKANKYVATLHEKITNQRVDYCHKITTGLIRDNQAETFVIEDLAVVNMLKNRKLSQAISDVSFGEFFRQMKYKSDWYGKNLIVIGRFEPSSKRCSDCGRINDGLTLSDREWTCECGTKHDRDLNAAKNIKFFGLNTPMDNRGGPIESRRLRRAKK